ncbi:MAG: hypothetical protein ABW321_24170 [Polyangiales bacterium]
MGVFAVHGRARLAVLWWVACLAVCQVACQAGDDTIRTETLRLASGDFAQLTWGGTQLERFYVLARPNTPEGPGPGVMLVSPENETPCVLGESVASYIALQPRLASKYVIGSPSPARIIWFESFDADGFGALRFADINCKRSGFSVRDISNMWFLYEPDRVKVKLAVLDRDRSLIFVDPWAEEQQEVSRDLKEIATFETGAWVIEEGELVKRDIKGNATLRIGSDVVSFNTLSSSDDVAYNDGSGALYALRKGVVKKIANEGCGAQALDAFMPGALGYFSPCESRTLRVVVGDSPAIDYATGVDAVREDSGLLLYTTHTETRSILWGVTSATPTQPMVIAELPLFSLERTISIGGQVLLVGRRQDTNTRTVWQLRKDDPTRLMVLTAGVVDYRLVQEGVAALYDTGELVVSDRTLSRIMLRLTNVRPGHFRFVFSQKATAFAYRADVDETTGLGDLELHMLNGPHFSVAHDVREFQEVWWPERGILYATGGDDPGIFFARVDIPCESTSDTAWACGF